MVRRLAGLARRLVGLGGPTRRAERNSGARGRAAVCSGSPISLIYEPARSVYRPR
ncbi:hypothetical protein E2C01_089889 [Portunus trituberculatus]|uniref:Uncharacterized protein n=1 Tax=Portunus trituberculatus TaxID=210409 RepID=A0A5B7JD90_PORTR|nr:hypothetical protein [Portunus trituberculatus]